nr:T9SS type A sorting domain-containing protein [uncultured Lacibacter sp.]
MKTVVPVLLFLFAIASGKAQSTKDLPSPVANLQTLAAGSYVIPMDNNLQLNASGHFNLKSYGLIVHLLNYGVKVKWAIRAGKTKDGIDFTGTGTQLLPSSTVVPSVYNFIAGPFVIAAADTAGVAAIVQSFYTNNGLTGSNRPAVYKLTLASLNVDIRYDLSGFIPKGAVLNDGANTPVHIGYMVNCAIPTTNYTTASALDLLTRCFTFASEPHIDDSVMNTAYADAVRIFVSYGGNFLAQCEAILSYENRVNGHFQSTNGITKVNLNFSNAQTEYLNPDLAYSQYHGAFRIWQGGSVRNWVLSTGSFYQNNTHHHATGTSNTPVGASVSKINSATQAGGLIYYIGSHEFSSTSAIESINGIRMYMNAFLTPTGLGLNCGTLGQTMMWVLSLKLSEFTAQQKNEYAELNWKTASGSTASQFIIERSLDGTNFREAGIVFSKTGTEESVAYKFKEQLRTGNGSTIYYRIRTEDSRGKYEYSDIRVLKLGAAVTAEMITTYPNPVVNKLVITLPATWNGKQINYEIVDLNGKPVARFSGAVNSNTQEANIGHLSGGYYYVRVNCNGEQVSKKIFKK